VLIFLFDFVLLRLENDTCLYGVFDGIGGSKVAAYAAQNMPAEILLGQLVHKNTDDELKQVLHQVFEICWNTESCY
jgi:serine/threonine protein phosphatase PrpC